MIQEKYKRMVMLNMWNNCKGAKGQVAFGVYDNEDGYSIISAASKSQIP